MSQQTTQIDAIGQPVSAEPESLFERFHWLYAFCREHLFRDDTEQIASNLWPDAEPPLRARLLEIGCGPGFYSCRLAARFERLHVTGIDRAGEQLSRARKRATEKHLDNCRFEKADVHALAWARASFDAVVASRLFTILPELCRYQPIAPIATSRARGSPRAATIVALPQSSVRRVATRETSRLVPAHAPAES